MIEINEREFLKRKNHERKKNLEREIYENFRERKFLERKIIRDIFLRENDKEKMTRNEFFWEKKRWEIKFLNRENYEKLNF